MKNIKQKLIRWLRKKINNKQFYLDFIIYDMYISLWEMAHDLSLNKITFEEYDKFYELIRLHEKCLNEGLQYFSWEYLGQNGFLSPHDEETFKQQIGNKDIKYKK